MCTVHLNCETGTWQLVGDVWERARHDVTWASYETLAEAAQVASELMTDPRTRAWVTEER